MADTEQSKILASLKKKSKTAYAKVKDNEAKAAPGRLPAGLRGARGKVTATLDTWDDGKPRINFNVTCTEPEECRGSMGRKTDTLDEDKFNTYDENIDNAQNDLKLLGFTEEVTSSVDMADCLGKVLKRLEKGAVECVFNTGAKLDKNGYPRLYFEENENGDTTTAEETEDTTEAPFSGIGEKADNGDEDAQAVLTERAGELGLDVNEIDTWAEVEEQINNLSGDDEEETDTDNPEIEEGDRVKTHPDYFEDGNSYEANVLEVLDGEVRVQFTSDDTIDTVPLDQIEVIEG